MWFIPALKALMRIVERAIILKETFEAIRDVCIWASEQPGGLPPGYNVPSLYGGMNQ